MRSAMRLSKYASLVALLLATATNLARAQIADATPEPPQPIDWRAVTTADVEAAYRATAENHPGMHDPTNPRFAALVDKARAQSLQLAGRARTPTGYAAALGRFRSVLDDGHAGAYARLPDKLSAPLRWPGFVAAWRGNAMYVHRSAEGGPPAGAKIASCDGKPIRALVNRLVFDFEDGRRIPGRWWSGAQRMFIDKGNPFVAYPKSCVFERDGLRRTRMLRWSPVADDFQSWSEASANGERLPIAMTEPAPGLFWMAMPDFNPDDAGMEAYKKMYVKVAANRDKLLGARAIVLDLRFNRGGSSAWSHKLAEHLWGKARTERLVEWQFRNAQVWWRPTVDNLAKVKQVIALLEQRRDAETAAFFKKVATPFEEAAGRGDKFFVEPEMSPRPTAEPATDADGDPPALTTPVYVIVPGQCASACLDAIDVFKLFPNTRLIGAPSSADSTYLEVRLQPLPSGFGNTIIPMKMWVQRPRGNGVHYAPDITMTDLDWSSDSFRKRIEAALDK